MLYLDDSSELYSSGSGGGEVIDMLLGDGRRPSSYLLMSCET